MNNPNIQTEQPKSTKVFGENFNTRVKENTCCVTAYILETCLNNDFCFALAVLPSSVICSPVPFCLASCLIESALFPVTLTISAIQALCDTKKQNQDNTPTLV